MLGVIAALSVGDLLNTRQRYEDALSRSYQLEAVSARLLAVGVLEEQALGRTDPGGPRARRRARLSFAGLAAQARRWRAATARAPGWCGPRAASQRRTRRLAAPRGPQRAVAQLAAPRRAATTTRSPRARTSGEARLAR